MPKIGSINRKTIFTQKPFWTTPDGERCCLYLGDCLKVLKQLPERSVQCCITSPPYFGLRDYGTATWEGGDPACDHGRARKAIGNTPSAKSTLTTNGGRGPKPGDKYSSESQGGYANDCPCGARRIDAQLGLEKTPQEYVARMVAVFREVRRVLRDDGTLWLNLGDTYSTHAAGKCKNPMATSGLAGVKTQEVARATKEAQEYRNSALPEKNLLGIPWRVAFALQADGWYLRQDTIWAKPNPMPESVTDRCTKAHEYVFLLSKSPRYYYDAEAIKEEASQDYAQSGRRRNPDKIAGKGFEIRGGLHEQEGAAFRNRRSVWTVATQPYPGAHFATFPTELIRPMVRAGTSERGACVRCGSPWRRIVKTDNWEATCRCRDGVGVRPCVVLDPFVGSGTTCMVALEEGRSAWGVELSEKYLTENAIVRITSPKKRSKRQLMPPEGVPCT